MGWAAPGSRAKARGSSRRELFTAAGQPKGFERRGLGRPRPVGVLELRVHETPRTATSSASCSLLADRGGDRGPATSCKRWLSTPAAGARCKPCGRAPAHDRSTSRPPGDGDELGGRASEVLVPEPREPGARPRHARGSAPGGGRRGCYAAPATGRAGSCERRATETGAPAGTATSEATRRRSELAGERPHKRPCGGARRLGAADGGRSMTATLGGC